MAVAMKGTKRCPDCGETKSVADFYLNRASGTGIDSVCASCKRIRHHAYPTSVSERAMVAAAKTAAQVAEVWVDWVTRRRPADREALIVHYRPLVEGVAGSMVSRLTRSAEREDLAGYGVLGLIDAVDRYDASRGVPFERYAAIRIEGAIVDGLRGVAWEPRSVRVRARDVAAARSRLEHDRGRSVNEAEIAQELGLSGSEVARVLTDMHTAGTTSLTDQQDNLGAPAGDGRFPVDIENLQAALADAIVELPGRERVVFALHYQEEMTLGGIGELLGVSAVRITQILNDAIANIQRRLAGR